MPAERGQWAAAYAAQSLSDWQVYVKMSADGEVEPCHRLHYLQMACEKIAKAYRLRDTAVDFESATRHHVGFTSFVASYLPSGFIRAYYLGKPRARERAYHQGLKLARQIERLAPAADSEQTPSNVEYAWAVGGDVLIPCRDSFSDLARLQTKDGRNFLKLIKLAITEFSQAGLSLA